MAIVALMLPLAIGLSFFISSYFSMTQYSTSMISLIGIAVSIDYSLFMISRFREELDGGASTEDAIATMMHRRSCYTLFRSHSRSRPLQPILLHRNTHAIYGHGSLPSRPRGTDVFLDLTSCPSFISWAQN